VGVLLSLQCRHIFNIVMYRDKVGLKEIQSRAVRGALASRGTIHQRTKHSRRGSRDTPLHRVAPPRGLALRIRLRGVVSAKPLYTIPCIGRASCADCVNIGGILNEFVN
jgi:hypothetical protein